MNRLSPAILLLLVGCGLTGCGKQKPKTAENEAPAPVQVEEARKGPIDHIISAEAHHRLRL